MEFETPNKEALVRLVQKCLSQNSEGFIERDQFIEFCSDLSVSTDELDCVFNELDNDRDGRINVSDFTSSFEQVVTFKSDNSSGETVNGFVGSVDKSLYECQVNSLESPMQAISTNGQQYISELYYNLTNSNQPDLLDLFEKHLASVVKDIKAKAAENQRLEEALKRATKQHARQVNNLDREVEQQMEKLEAKVRQEEKSSYEKKVSDFEWQLEGKDKEISAMNKTIETIQTRLDKETNKPNFRREELENTAQENRYLKSQVTDSQTTLALLRSELAEIKSQFVEQSDQLQKEQWTAQASMYEQENLVRQLQLLYEANQRLQDVNDELRGALEAKKSWSLERKTSSEVLRLSGVFPDLTGNPELSPSLKRSNTFPRNATPPLVSRLPEHQGTDYNDNTFNENSLFSEIHRASTPYKSDSVDEEDDEAYGTMSKSRKAEVQRQIQILEDTNTRLSSSNDELRVALKMMSRSGSFRKPKKNSSGNRRGQNSHSDYSSLSSNRSSRSFSPKDKRLSNGDIGEATDESTTYDVEEEENIGTDSTATMNSETIGDLEAQFKKIKESKDEGEEKSSKSDVDDDDDDEMDSAELAELVAMASDLTDVTDSESETAKSESTKTEEISTMTTMASESLSASYGTPERMYKLVLAGDAAVGKSSFILRLCKNKFHSSLNATLGVDFQVKNLRVDSKTVALQLWDTAGQERFRSIAKSYFRKVDGVLLLYDVTCESSFVNIRDWMSTIEESSQKKVPIMLCGNKCDLRDSYIREGRKVVSTESGQRLAKHYDALFIETSAKDGSHIEDACKKLARILTSLENEEIEQSGLRLDKKDKDKKKRPCCPS